MKIIGYLKRKVFSKRYDCANRHSPLEWERYDILLYREGFLGLSFCATLNFCLIFYVIFLQPIAFLGYVVLTLTQLFTFLMIYYIRCECHNVKNYEYRILSKSPEETIQIIENFLAKSKIGHKKMSSEVLNDARKQRGGTYFGIYQLDRDEVTIRVFNYKFARKVQTYVEIGQFNAENTKWINEIQLNLEDAFRSPLYR